jgi:hypothetical protein
MILMIILVHNISYSKPERPDRKKQQRTKKNTLPLTVLEALFSGIVVTYSRMQ